MTDNAVDFSFANLNGANTITVMGCEAHLIERAIKAIKRLVSCSNIDLRLLCS